MKVFRPALLLLLLVLLCPNTAQDKRVARLELNRMNVPFTNDAFILSIIEGNKAQAELFLAAGMSPNATYTGEPIVIAPRVITEGQTALQVALAFDRMDFVRLLLEKGADVNQPANYGTLLEATGPLVKVLLDSGADVNEGVDGGQTALMEAARDGDLYKLRLLLDYGADVNAKSKYGASALRNAAVGRHREAVKMLIEHGADLSEFSDRAIGMMTHEPDRNDQVMQLISRLYEKRSGYSITGPSIEDQQQIPARLLEIANESAESRANVIERMIDVVEDPAAQDELMIAHAWMTAVDVLGKLRATEAIDVLVENLDRTGQNGIVLSIHIKPVYSALVRIGDPAVPKLIYALSHAKPAIRKEAAWVLFSINRDEAKTALEAAYQTEKVKSVKEALKYVIERIEQGY